MSHSWDCGTFRPPYTHSSNAHAQPSSGARSLIFGRTLRLLPYFMCANSKGSGETARMRRLAWAFAGRLCDKYHNLMSWLKSFYNCVYSSTSLWNVVTMSSNLAGYCIKVGRKISDLILRNVVVFSNFLVHDNDNDKYFISCRPSAHNNIHWQTSHELVHSWNLIMQIVAFVWKF